MVERWAEIIMRDHEENLTCGMSRGAVVNFVDGTATESDVAQVESHRKSGCPACDEAIASMGALVADLRASRLFEAPLPNLDPIRAMFRERMKGRARPPLFARRLLDTRLQVATGFRGGPPESFRLLFGTAFHDIDVWHEPQLDGTWYVIGQALSRGGDDPDRLFGADYVSDARTVHAIVENQEFHFSAIASGLGVIRIQLESGPILLPESRLGA